MHLDWGIFSGRVLAGDYVLIPGNGVWFCEGGGRVNCLGFSKDTCTWSGCVENIGIRMCGAH